MTTYRGRHRASWWRGPVRFMGAMGIMVGVCIGAAVVAGVTIWLVMK